jgi:hypothetical protein
VDINLVNGIGVRTHKPVWFARFYDKHIPSPGFVLLTIHGPVWTTGNDVDDFVVFMPVKPRTATWFRDHQEEPYIGVMLGPLRTHATFPQTAAVTDA